MLENTKDALYQCIILLELSYLTTELIKNGCFNRNGIAK